MPVNEEVYSLFKNSREISFDNCEPFSEMKESATGVFMVKRGIVKIFNHTGADSFLLGFGMEGDLIGVDSLFTSITFQKNYQPVRGTQLYYLPGNVFINRISKNKSLVLAILRYLSEKSDELEARTCKLHHKSVEANFAELLVSLSGINLPEFIPQVITTTDIANVIGTTKNYVYKTIKKMEDQRIISFKDRKLKVINKTMLRKLAQSKTTRINPA